MKIHTLHAILSSPISILWPDLNQKAKDEIHSSRTALRRNRKQERQNRRRNRSRA